jgi:N-methylhydantoinase B
MPLSVEAGIQAVNFKPGDVLILNDPYRGGTHLPDITLITPIFVGQGDLFGFAANRAHHADVGGMSPGSMPLSQELLQEGLIIPPIKIVEAYEINQTVFDFLLANVRTPEERAGDLRAQIAANRKGVDRVGELVARYGRAEVVQYMQGLLHYAERMTRQLLDELPDGLYRFRDQMDDDGIDPEPAEIVVEVSIQGDQAIVNFSGTSPQRRGSINAVYAITLSAVQYVFRALIGLDIPSNSGCLVPIQVIAPEGTLVNAKPPAAVAAGNVETSQRIVDVLLGALAQACPDRVPAASQGTMNNLTIGGVDQVKGSYAYYETVGGGAGACPNRDGADAIHSHMTNTMNTPIEALEFAYPFHIRKYAIRQGSGGHGQHRGGDGICREFEFNNRTHVTILSERRKFPPFGLAGGQPGKPGCNTLVSRGEVRELPGKVSLEVEPGDIVRIETPGGGGFGAVNGAKNGS